MIRDELVGVMTELGGNAAEVFALKDLDLDEQPDRKLQSTRESLLKWKAEFDKRSAQDRINKASNTGGGFGEFGGGQKQQAAASSEATTDTSGGSSSSNEVIEAVGSLWVQPSSTSTSNAIKEAATEVERQWMQRRRMQLEFRRDELARHLQTTLQTFDSELMEVCDPPPLVLRRQFLFFVVPRAPCAYLLPLRNSCFKRSVMWSTASNWPSTNTCFASKSSSSSKNSTNVSKLVGLSRSTVSFVIVN